MTVVTDVNNKLISTKTLLGWRIWMDYQKLNKSTIKKYFCLPFIDQMLNMLAIYEYYFFLYGYLRYNQITITLKDQEKTIFTFVYGTFAFWRMSFGHCNEPTTFQRCMWQSSWIWWRRLLKFSWMIFLCSMFVLMIGSSTRRVWYEN